MRTISYFLLIFTLLTRCLPAAAESFSIKNAKLITLSATHGLWQGYVQGVGRLELRLQIIQNGRSSSRSMGYLTLAPGDPAIKFNFKSVLPESPEWSWKIVATPKQKG